MHFRRVTVLVCALLLCAAPPLRAQGSPVGRDEPPRADRITLSPPDEDGQVLITGAADSVFPGAAVGIRNLFSGELDYAQASFTGAFAAMLPGVAGAPYLLQTDNAFPPSTAAIPGALPGDIGVIVYAPLPEAGFSAAGLNAGVPWTAEGTVNSLRREPGDMWILQLAMHSPAPLPFDAHVLLQPIAQLNGGTLQAVSVPGISGWSAETTPSGLPLDGLGSALPLGALRVVSVQSTGGDGARFVLRFNAPLPESLPAGLYAPALALPDGGLSRLPLVLQVGPAAPVVLPMALFMDHGADGARGLLPVEASGALSHGVRWNGPDFILSPGSYPLEPYLPTVLLNRGDSYAPPLIPFDLPNGRLTVSVVAPDGSLTDLSAPITQSWLGSTAEDEADRFGGGPVDMFRLTTGDPRMSAFTFDQYGEYVITLNAELSDRFGHAYSGGGVYRLLIAEPLDLHPGLLPGAPIPAGAVVYTGLRITPPVPAAITAEFVSVNLAGAARTTRVNGAADRYGVFRPANPLTLSAPGDYRFDATAAYTDAAGRLWAGSLRSAGVIVDTAAPLIAHGGRGVYGQPEETSPARYSLRGLASLLNDNRLLEGAVLNQPFFTGAVAHLGDGPGFGLAFPINLQDVEGDYTRWLVEARIASEQQSARGVLPAVAPGRGYAYTSAVTAGFSVRQQALSGPASGLRAWVDGDDPLNQQIGAGVNGLAPGDLVFLFGGAVVRAPEAGVETTAGYAALAVIGANDDPGQLGVLEPAQLGAAPLAFIPTGVIPGQRLTVGERLVIAGHIAPPLAGQVTAEITNPAGTVQTVTLPADEYGYAYDPAAAVAADSPGVWTIRLRASTEAGSAGVPGAVDGLFSVYVLPADSTPLPWASGAPDLTIPGATPYSVNFAAPADWTDVRGYVTLTTPGAVLADGAAQLTGRSLTATYSPPAIQADFPNFEVEGRSAGAHVSDSVTLTVALTGLDAGGQPQIQARAFTILHNRLISLEPGEAAP